MRLGVEITRNPHRLAALCHLWRRQEAEIWLTLEGYSMLPGIPPGSRVRVSFGYYEPSIGEVVAALQGSRLLIHRLVRIDRGSTGTPLYVCQGDANPRPDPPVPAEQLVGIVREHRRPSGITRLHRGIRRLLRHSLVSR